MNNNTTEDYVSFEVAKLLKEKGFAWLDHTLIAKDGKLVWSNPTGVPTSLDNGYNCYEENGVPIRPRKYTPTNTHYPRPTHALAIKWIRENFGIHIYAQFQTWDDGCYTANWCLKQDILWLFYDIGVKEKDGMLWKRTKFNKPEEATEAALLHTLQNLIP